ncbi:MAG: helix-turn-helix domain-containing protein [Alphaproteobacteria bacterium]|nr:helix-turn-helix domain-containing protein [Alphaproteobacteria bacterium]
MSDVAQTLPSEERKERRRLHLREAVEQPAQLPEAPQPDEPRSSVGEKLRTARVERGQDVAAVAKLLKMRREQLEAVETGNLAKLPGRTYAVGFVRAYARHLGLDAETLVQQFKDETAEQDAAKPVNLVFPVAQEEFRGPRGSIMAIALLIAMGIYGITYVTMPNRNSAATAAQPEQTAVVVEQAAPTKTPVAPVTAPDSNQTPVEVAVSFVAGNPTLPEQKLPSAPALEPVVTPAPITVAQAVPPQMPPVEANARIVLKAVEPTYVQVRDAQLPRSKSVLVARVLNVGESYAVPNRTGLTMQTGNAGGLQVEVDGRSLGVFGKSGQVITRIPLDPSYFVERMAASQ